MTRFEVYLARYEPQPVGAEHHVEYWSPAEELEEFNDNIVGVIELVGRYPKVV